VGERRARLHLRLGEAAAAASRWATAQEQLGHARAHATEEATAVRVDALAARVLLDAGRAEDAEPTARRALAAAEHLRLPEPACQALEVLGRILRRRDVEEAEALFARQLQTARAHGLTLWTVRATHELGAIDLIRHTDTTRLRDARELALAAGVLSTVATLDLQLAAAAWTRLDGDDCVGAARRCADAARRSGSAGAVSAASATGGSRR
jgi:hypothetical protein